MSGLTTGAATPIASSIERITGSAISSDVCPAMSRFSRSVRVVSSSRVSGNAVRIRLVLTVPPGNSITRAKVEESIYMVSNCVTVAPAAFGFAAMDG